MRYLVSGVQSRYVERGVLMDPETSRDFPTRDNGQQGPQALLPGEILLLVAGFEPFLRRSDPDLQRS